MASQGPKQVRQSELYGDARGSELKAEGGEPSEKRPILKILGGIRERGFSKQSFFDKITVPQPRVTPFPIARHRSDGPNWGPTSQSVYSAPTPRLNEVDDYGDVSAGVSAEPLRRQKSQGSQWRSNRQSVHAMNVRTQEVFDDTQNSSRQHSEITGKFDGQVQRKVFFKVEGIEPNTMNTMDTNRNFGAGQSMNEFLGKQAQEGRSKVPNSNAVEVVDIRLAHGKLLSQLEDQIRNPLNYEGSPALLDASVGKEEEFELRKQVSLSQPSTSTDSDIDAENRKALSKMSPEEIVEAQAELARIMQPKVLERLRRQGAEKERKRIEGKIGSSELAERVTEAGRVPGNQSELIESSISSPATHVAKVPFAGEDEKFVTKTSGEVKNSNDFSDRTPSKRMDSVRGTKVGPVDLLTARGDSDVEVPANTVAEETSSPNLSTDQWTIRVEAVRRMQFGLNGTLLGITPVTGDNGNCAANSQHSILNVVERDYLRMEGDPVGSGYSIKEALALVRSTVPGQRAVGLRLTASILDNAMTSVQNQKFDPSLSEHHEGIKGSVDWQAVWAYALGPEAEVVLTLRLALDDGHSTVVAASAMAIQALLSYSANESYFESLEALWPGDKIVYTAPIFRRKSPQSEGFIGGGPWKYNVKNQEMFPFLNRPDDGSAGDNGKDTVADDGHVSNKDVAAGLIRMGVLPRIRYILEVDKLVAAQEALLNILICIARHSPTGANAVMKCPRLIDAILQRFTGTDGSLTEESWSARLKAIRLLKVLSQAKRSNCVYFEETGVLQTLMIPVLQDFYVNQPLGHAQDLKPGYYEIMIETIRFWRVCIDYHIGISLFSECYSTLCFWLLPLSREEIVTSGRDEPLLLVIESYLLLEHIAKTLPVLHGKHCSTGFPEQENAMNWSWRVATVVLETAINWLSPNRIAGVCELLEHDLQTQIHYPLSTVLETRTVKFIRIVAAVLHFLATVCEKVVCGKELQNVVDDLNKPSIPWLPAFIPNLGLALVRSAILKYPWVEDECKLSELMSGKVHSLLVSLSLYKARADHDTALVTLNCLGAIVRVSTIMDRLIDLGKPTRIPSLLKQTEDEKVLNHGLLRSSERELRSLLVLCRNDVISSSHLMQMSIRGGPAPGLGIGWGAFCGGAWSKEVLIAQIRAKLAVDLMSVTSPCCLEERGEIMHRDDPASEDYRSDFNLFSVDLSWKINLGFAVLATSTPLNRDFLHQVSSNVIFHPHILSIMIQKIQEALTGWHTKRNVDGFHDGHIAKDPDWDPKCLNVILCQHFKSFWLAVKGTKYHDRASRGDRVAHRGSSKTQSRCRPVLPTVHEEAMTDATSHPESLTREWVGQKLPPPSHWFLSPMVIDLADPSREALELGLESASEQTLHLEKAVKAGLACFLGFEVLGANGSLRYPSNLDVPLVRKIHSLSTLFTLGGDIFLHPDTGYLIQALQSLLGDQIEKLSACLLQNRPDYNVSATMEDNERNGVDKLKEHGNGLIVTRQDDRMSENLGNTVLSIPVKGGILDFEGSIDASYLNYAEIIAEQFVATSFGDLAFARQVSLHLCLYVTHMIRLATWRTLTDGRVLELLPRLSQCCGPSHIYLYPLEDNQQMLESYMSAWSSGALDKAAVKDSLPFTLALHHLAGFIFAKSDSDEIALSKKKTLRTLVRSCVGKLDRQEMLSKLVYYMPPLLSNCGPITEVSEGASTELVKCRVLLLSEACQGDRSLVAEVQRLQNGII